jgi:hypothetical protein
MNFGSQEVPRNNNHEARPIRPENMEAKINADIIIESLENEKVKEADFIDENKKGFTRVDVEHDMGRVAARKEDFRSDQDHLTDLEIEKIEVGKKRATALEKICINMAGKRDKDGSSRYAWYGQNSYTVETSEFDDICNGIDGILEFDLGSGQSRKIGLAIDASMKPDFSSIMRKMKRGAEKMVDGGGQVKYFKSAVNGEKGKLKNVIPIVLGLEGDKANELIRLFAEIVTLENKMERSADEDMNLAYKIREAQQHPCQVIFLKEMKIQLEMYKKHFAQGFPLLENNLGELLRIIYKLLLSKNSIEVGTLEHDGVYQKIREVSIELPKIKDDILARKRK